VLHSTINRHGANCLDDLLLWRTLHFPRGGRGAFSFLFFPSRTSLCSLCSRAHKTIAPVLEIVSCFSATISLSGGFLLHILLCCEQTCLAVRRRMVGKGKRRGIVVVPEPFEGRPEWRARGPHRIDKPTRACATKKGFASAFHSGNRTADESGHP
jgi:hypothetical protein